MNWDRQTRIRLARMISAKCQEIQNQCILESRLTGNWPKILELTDERTMNLLEPLGFKRANKDWEHDALVAFVLFKQSDTHLWFETAQGRIVKIEKTKAERVLVLGLP